MPNPELEQRVARAADTAWLEAVEALERAGIPKYPRDIIRTTVIPAVLKAHAEWLASADLQAIAAELWPHVGPATHAGRIATAKELIFAALQQEE